MCAQLQKPATPYQSRRGFTIVELLIVIVVIGILAAITIVAYNGIQNRAHAAQAQSAASHLTTLLANYNTLNGSYPTDLSTVNNDGPLSNSDGTTYAYHPGTSNGSYCVTVTNATTSYVITDTAPAPTIGGCPGDGQGGMAAITNLVPNPNLTSLSFMSGSGTATNTLETAGPASGTTFGRRTYTAASASGSIYLGNYSGIQVGRTYAASAMVRASKPTSLSLRIDWKATGGAFISSTSATVKAVGTSWTALSASGVAPDTATRVTITIPNSSSYPWAIGDYEDVDSVMLVDGASTGNFADGNTTNWIWNGTADNSTSTGPQQ